MFEIDWNIIMGFSTYYLWILFRYYMYFQVEELISNSQLNISSEEDVFTAVLNWVKHDLSERQQYISQVIQKIIFGY